MSNLQYWQLIADNSLPIDEEKYSGDIPLYDLEQYVSEVFEKGLALLITGDEQSGNRYLEFCEVLLSAAESKDSNVLYLTYRLILNWVKRKDIDSRVLSRLLEKKWEVIQNEIIRFEFRDIYNICIKSSMGRLKRDLDVEKINFRKSSHDKYHYEALGDHLIEVSRLLLLDNKFRAAKLSLEGAQKLYGIALGLIPRMMTRRNRKWKDVEDKTDIQIKKEFPNGEYDYYLEERENLRGDIPLYRWQGEVMINLEKYLGHTTEVKIVKKKIEDFFNEVINPAEKMSSSMSLLDELAWVLLKLRFEQKSFKASLYQDPIEYLRDNLS